MKRSTTINVLFYGIGGQGVLTAAELCGWAALLEGYHVKKSEVHGMAQRGGSVESHLRFGEKVFSPLIPRGTADFLVCFYREEHDRLLDFLKPGGIDLTAYLEKGAARIVSPRYLNTFLVGVLSRHLPIKEENWTRALEAVFPPARREENRKVFLQGRGEPL